MDRRLFLSMLGLGVAAGAAVGLEQAIPFGRVWSFPTKIVTPLHLIPVTWYSLEDIKMMYLEPAAKQMAIEIDELYAADRKFLRGEKWPIPAARPGARPLPS